jgi:aspartyl-tRNA(Asn)/glutamyl-tRNA(Gln) amidotransferase subunit C
MPLSREDVVHVASLCRIYLTEDEVLRLQQQLSDILAQFEALQAVDTDNVAPEGHAARSTVMRPDAAAASASVEDVLANAPQQERGFFRVQAVLEEL